MTWQDAHIFSIFYDFNWWTVIKQRKADDKQCGRVIFGLKYLRYRLTFIEKNVGKYDQGVFSNIFEDDT